MDTTTIVLFVAFLFASSQFLIKLFERNRLQKEKQELEDENKKLEYFISEHFLRVMNDEELGQIFLTIINNYTQGKGLPKNFLYLVCGYSRCYDLMHSTILLEIDRFARTVSSKLSNPSINDCILKQKKLNDLLEELEEINKKRKGKLQFIDAPDILYEQVMVTSPNFKNEEIISYRRTDVNLEI